MRTPLPTAITRDDTVHGRLYFTRHQLLDYGDRRVADAMAEIDALSTKNDDKGQSKTVNELMRMFGMKS